MYLIMYVPTDILSFATKLNYDTCRYLNNPFLQSSML